MSAIPTIAATVRYLDNQGQPVANATVKARWADPALVVAVTPLLV